MSNWIVEFVNDIAEKEIKSLPSALQADFLHILELLIEFGPNSIGMPSTRRIAGKIWEARLKSGGNIARLIYYVSPESKIVILHSFIKKTQQTSIEAIKIAKHRLKDSHI